MKVRDTEYEVDADCWGDVMQYLSGRSGAVAIFAYKVVSLPGSQPQKKYARRLKRTVTKAVTSLSSAMRPAARKSIRAQSDCIAGSDARWWLANPSA